MERLRRGAVEVITDEDLRKKLALNRPLVIKAGFDPTAPDLHLGHTVLLRKLRQFQDLGHQVIFLIGDATALVGDPSGQSKMRKLMTPEEIEANAGTYRTQAQKILTSGYRTQFNSEWFGGGRGGHNKMPFGLKELVELTSRYTVARLIERDDFQKRMKAGQEVSMLELFYPLMQGYDSVMLKADVELGGTDQKFNLLVGRDLQRAYGQEPQVVITMPLLEGTDGVQKMSKSLGNHIAINEPPGEMFGKLMSIPDTLIVKYFTLLTDADAASLAALERRLAGRAVNPRDAKADLAETVTTIYHGPAPARLAREEFARVFSRRQMPAEMPEIALRAGPEGTVDLVSLLVEEGLAKTKNEARRLIGQGGVKLNGVPLKRPALPGAEAAGILQVGSRHFRKLVRRS
ncbi:MAG: tyrosine--tRNA ligase [Omnitrophica WOR_2 bacterium RIFCSPHIGHO2_02_FULL_67_20]|nr:MAG: tyrosine--tRNA ligase [Omnitrophica WOR_2 bacterium RIFCSPHIGHO2_02_FULL_67_20]